MLKSLLDFYTFFEDQFNVRLENKLSVLDGIKLKGKACIIIFFQGLIEKNPIRDSLGTFFLVFHRNCAPPAMKIRSTQVYKLVTSSSSVALTLP